MEAVAFPWPVVQSAGDCVAPVLREPLHRGALRDVLPNEAVGVLVRASFPRRVRRREVDRYARSSFDLLVAVELRTVVDGDGLEQPGMRLNQGDDALIDCAARRRRSLPIRVAPVTRSTRVTMQCRSLAPTTTSISQCPISVRASTMAGRSEMWRLPERRPRFSWVP